MAEIKPVVSNLITEYKLQNILLQHYKIEGAISQKVNALIHRTESQARDVLDLKILKDQFSKPHKFIFSEGDKNKAIEIAMSISYDDYISQAWPYLIASFQEQYKSRETWNQIQEDVCAFMQKNLVTK